MCIVFAPVGFVFVLFLFWCVIVFRSLFDYGAFGWFCVVVFVGCVFGFILLHV